MGVGVDCAVCMSASVGAGADVAVDVVDGVVNVGVNVSAGVAVNAAVGVALNDGPLDVAVHIAADVEFARVPPAMTIAGVRVKLVRALHVALRGRACMCPNGGVLVGVRVAAEIDPRATFSLEDLVHEDVRARVAVRVGAAQRVALATVAAADDTISAASPVPEGVQVRVDLDCAGANVRVPVDACVSEEVRPNVTVCGDCEARAGGSDSVLAPWVCGAVRVQGGVRLCASPWGPVAAFWAVPTGGGRMGEEAVTVREARSVGLSVGPAVGIGARVDVHVRLVPSTGVGASGAGLGV